CSCLTAATPWLTNAKMKKSLYWIRRLCGIPQPVITADQAIALAKAQVARERAEELQKATELDPHWRNKLEGIPTTELNYGIPYAVEHLRTWVVFLEPNMRSATILAVDHQTGQVLSESSGETR